MTGRTCLLAAALCVSNQIGAFARDPAPQHQRIPDGVYAVLRDSDQEKGVLPLKDGEALVVNRYRYQKADKEPPRCLVVHATPEVALDLAAEPNADRDGEEVVRIFLKLKPEPARALEKLTRELHYKQVAVVLDGDVVTVHKIRETIANGDVQVTSCSPGGAAYLLKQLQAHRNSK